VVITDKVGVSSDSISPGRHRDPVVSNTSLPLQVTFYTPAGVPCPQRRRARPLGVAAGVSAPDVAPTYSNASNGASINHLDTSAWA